MVQPDLSENICFPTPILLINHRCHSSDSVTAVYGQSLVFPLLLSVFDVVFSSVPEWPSATPKSLRVAPVRAFIALLADRSGRKVDISCFVWD